MTAIRVAHIPVHIFLLILLLVVIDSRVIHVLILSSEGKRSTEAQKIAVSRQGMGRVNDHEILDGKTPPLLRFS
ncbi:hypothetical protein PL9214650811 [Planktothrix tepida PCC 9214]|uniref:Uncharacterized protein n=1 Tax=Planktothrix tepida PCC 9214 TaxID=671072 RepID=A0A1J1LU51_9CYAN|nr:hypothetical protein PL9214650811 [Planktothrix tepida PCC 9214]